MSHPLIPQPLKPINETEATRWMQRRFHRLLSEASYPHSLEEEDAVESLTLRIQEEVSAHPILARIVSPTVPAWSLLDVLCRKNSDCREVIKFLVEVNPHALLLARPSFDQFIYRAPSPPIHVLADKPWNCALLPWLAERFPWVLQNDVCRKKPPHCTMVRCYARGTCRVETVQRFYELYPQGLQEPFYGSYPLSILLEGPRKPDAYLFIWMANEYPQAVYYKQQGTEQNLLHRVCESLAGAVNVRTPHMADICQFLISEHADLVWQKAYGLGALPIHILAKRCNRPNVQKLVMLLLKAYPECVQIKAGDVYPELSTVPFIQQVHSLMEDEFDVEQEIVMLPQIVENMAAAAALPNSSAFITSLLGSVSEVFLSWGNLRVSEVLPAKKQRIQERIADTCRIMNETTAPM